jgi:hypothetical protein
MRTIIKSLIVIMLIPLALTLGVYGCTMAHVAALGGH